MSQYLVCDYCDCDEQFGCPPCEDFLGGTREAVEPCPFHSVCGCGDPIACDSCLPCDCEVYELDRSGPVPVYRPLFFEWFYRFQRPGLPGADDVPF